MRSFVEAAAGPGALSAPAGAAPPEPPGRSGRRERRERRRGRRHWLRAGEEAAAPAGERQEPRTPGGRQRLAPARPAPPAAASSASARRRALLAANEAEEREIRRLERRLGLRKRRGTAPERGQGAAAALPRSFVRDGLGYVLGALEAGGATCAGLYESSEEEEEAAGGRPREPPDELSPMEEEGEEGGSSSPEEDPGSSEESPAEGEEAAEEGDRAPQGCGGPETAAQESMTAGEEVWSPRVSKAALVCI